MGSELAVGLERPRGRPDRGSLLVGGGQQLPGPLRVVPRDARGQELHGEEVDVGLSDEVRSLLMLGMMAASNKPAEFRVHAKGALANGCTAAQVQDVLLLVAMYCGVPAAIETTSIAAEVFGETPAAGAAKP